MVRPLSNAFTSVGTSVGPGRFVLGCVLALSAVAEPIPATCQSLSGNVRDAETGLPLHEVLVRAETNGAVALTGMDGGFVLSPVPPGDQVISFVMFGYEDQELGIHIPSDGPIEVLLEPRPFEMEELVVLGVPFRRRYERVERELDVRVARLPGDVQVVGALAIRPFVANHKSDPWKFFSSVLRIHPTMEDGVVRVSGAQVRAGRLQRPEVYVDDVREWLFEFVHAPLSQFCRVEFYTPIPNDKSIVHPPTQLRAYTCGFMAQVANGKREMKKWVNYGDLIAGPEGWIRE